MALDAEFKRHLHGLMLEVADKTRDEEVVYANNLKGQAIATHNLAAVPIAIKDAKLHALENRIGQTIAKYIEAVSIWGLTIDAALEKDMIGEFWHLTAGPSSLMFPPAINCSSHAQAVNRSYAMERQRLANRLVREGANRLRELKMKMKSQQSRPTSTTNINFNAPVGRVYSNSVDQSTSNFSIALPDLHDIERISEGLPELHVAAAEIRDAHQRGGSLLEVFLKWTTLLNSIEGLSEKIYHRYPQIAALVGRAAMVVQHLSK